jgi:hypothetical protein
MKIQSAGRLLVALVLATACRNAPAGDDSRDGRWWREATKDGQLGYIAGFFDCVVYDAGRVEFKLTNRWVIQSRMSAYYDAEPTRVRKALPDLLMQVAPDALQEPKAGGEKYPEKHGYFDGEFWRKAEADEQEAFVAGYLACWHSMGLGVAKYSRGATWYQARISGWYGTSGDSTRYRPDRRAAKIADALLMFRD